MLGGMVLELPLWVGYALIGAGMAGLGIPFLLAWWRAVKLDQEYLALGEFVIIRVLVRGLGYQEMTRFARCWNQAFEVLAAHGPWPRELLLNRLGPGNKVQVREMNQWKNYKGQLVGGELIEGILHVGPNLGVLMHELAHRAEYAIEHGETDLDHASWPRRGLISADEAYRAWLAKQV